MHISINFRISASNPSALKVEKKGSDLSLHYQGGWGIYAQMSCAFSFATSKFLPSEAKSAIFDNRWCLFSSSCSFPLCNVSVKDRHTRGEYPKTSLDIIRELGFCDLAHRTASNCLTSLLYSSGSFAQYFSTQSPLVTPLQAE